MEMMGIETIIGGVFISLLVNFILFLLKKIRELFKEKIKNIKIEEEEELKKYIIYLLIPEIRTSQIQYLIGETLKWAFIMILSFIISIILISFEMKFEFKIFDLIIDMGKVSFLAGAFCGFLLVKFEKKLKKLIDILKLNYNTLGSKIDEYNNKFGDKIDKETKKLFNEFRDKIKTVQTDRTIKKIGIKKLLSDLIKEYEG